MARARLRGQLYQQSSGMCFVSIDGATWNDGSITQSSEAAKDTD